MSTKKSKLISLTVSILWLVIIGAGLGLLWNYEGTPGAAAAAPKLWAGNSVIRRASDRPTLIMLVHPQCPCTRASIGELALIMAQSQGRLGAYVLFLKPTGFTSDWEKTDLWETARRIPGVTTIVAEGGAQALGFQAMTSGQTLLYDANGRLIFSGGITSSRGHSGDNAGRSAIVSLVSTGTAEQTQTPVYGCPLFDSNSECHKTDYDHDNH